jgi:hypothetical protein
MKRKNYDDDDDDSGGGGLPMWKKEGKLML